MYDTSYERIHGSSSLFFVSFWELGGRCSYPCLPCLESQKGTTPVHRPVNMNCQAVLGTLIQRPSRWGGVSCSSGARPPSRAHRTRALSDVTLLACQSVRGIQALCHRSGPLWEEADQGHGVRGKTGTRAKNNYRNRNDRPNNVHPPQQCSHHFPDKSSWAGPG